MESLVLGIAVETSEFMDGGVAFCRVMVDVAVVRMIARIGRTLGLLVNPAWFSFFWLFFSAIYAVAFNKSSYTMYYICDYVHVHVLYYRFDSS